MNIHSVAIRYGSEFVIVGETPEDVAIATETVKSGCAHRWRTGMTPTKIAKNPFVKYESQILPL